jgi:hypothetical protein
MRTYQIVKHTLVQLPLGLAALPELLVVVLEALPVFPEFLKAVLVDVFDPVQCNVSAYYLANVLIHYLSVSIQVDDSPGGRGSSPRPA